MSTAVRPIDKTALDRSSGNYALIDTLRKWGITFFSGVNGGGLIHVTKHLEPFLGLQHSGDSVPRMQTMGEYVAGFVPLGYYLASGRVAGCLTTTGAATKLGSSGITDAKLHNIPAVYVIALNSTLSIGRSPLQDVSEHGMNIIPQLRAELGEACIVIDDIDSLGDRLELAQSILASSKPVAIAFHPDILSKDADVDVPRRERPRMLDQIDADRFVNEFPQISRGRRVIIYAGAEAARCPGITELTTALSETLQAPTVWSVNGANAISPDNRYGYGYISFGGNDEAMKLWRSINSDDVVITLGFDSGEYSLNLGSIPAGHVWHFTAWTSPYGHQDGDFRHRVDGDYRVVRGDIEQTLDYVLPKLRGAITDGRPSTCRRTSTRAPSRARCAMAAWTRSRSIRSCIAHGGRTASASTMSAPRTRTASTWPRGRIRRFLSIRCTTAQRWAARSGSEWEPAQRTRACTPSCSQETGAGASTVGRLRRRRTSG